MKASTLIAYVATILAVALWGASLAWCIVEWAHYRGPNGLPRYIPIMPWPVEGT